MTDATEGDLRGLLFGDVPLSLWAAAGGDEPWSHFQRAKASLVDGDHAGAIAALRAVLALPDLESRHYLQAWDALRSLGELPAPAEAKRLYGVVLDIPVAGGLDTLAAYADTTCRYLNHSGAAIVWDVADAEIAGLIRKLFEVGRTIVDQIGPWDGPRPTLPPGIARLSLLCPGGLHFGQAPLPAFSAEPMAGMALGAAAQLLEALVERSRDER